MVAPVIGCDAEDYWSKRVAPLLPGADVRHRGQLSRAEKRAVFARASVTLFPVEWEEPFGLVMAESLASGTPVVAFDRGSVSEVVEHGVTGFIAPPGDTDTFCAYVERIGEIDRPTCRRQAVERFAPTLMADRYARLYGRLRRARTTTRHP
jgi:glycosyltransferase involved in cell wall biosynthesis